MPKKDEEALELEYAQAGPMIFQGEDGEYTIYTDSDLVLPAPGTEEIDREISLDKLRVQAVDTAHLYILSRREDREWLQRPLYIITSFFSGVGLMGVMWYLFNNGYVG